MRNRIIYVDLSMITSMYGAVTGDVSDNAATLHEPYEGRPTFKTRKKTKDIRHLKKCMTTVEGPYAILDQYGRESSSVVTLVHAVAPNLNSSDYDKAYFIDRVTGRLALSDDPDMARMAMTKVQESLEASMYNACVAAMRSGVGCIVFTPMGNGYFAGKFSEDMNGVPGIMGISESAIERVRARVARELSSDFHVCDTIARNPDGSAQYVTDRKRNTVLSSSDVVDYANALCLRGFKVAIGIAAADNSGTGDLARATSDGGHTPTAEESIKLRMSGYNALELMRNTSITLSPNGLVFDLFASPMSMGGVTGVSSPLFAPPPVETVVEAQHYASHPPYAGSDNGACAGTFGVGTQQVVDSARFPLHAGSNNGACAGTLFATTRQVENSVPHPHAVMVFDSKKLAKEWMTYAYAASGEKVARKCKGGKWLLLFNEGQVNDLRENANAYDHVNTRMIFWPKCSDLVDSMIENQPPKEGCSIM